MVRSFTEFPGTRIPGTTEQSNHRTAERFWIRWAETIRMIDIDPQQIKRILVRQVNWLGDAVLTLPALEALDRRFPQAEISVLAKPWVSGLFAGHPAVDRVLEYRVGDVHRGVMGRWRLANTLREGALTLR